MGVAAAWVVGECKAGFEAPDGLVVETDVVVWSCRIGAMGADEIGAAGTKFLAVIAGADAIGDDGILVVIVAAATSDFNSGMDLGMPCDWAVVGIR